MAKFDKTYIDLCIKILDEGVEVENRTGINTIKIPGYSFEHNVGDEFPILTTKQVYYKNAITEMLWIYQAHSNDVRWLHERDNHIWDEWMIDPDGVYRTYDPHYSIPIIDINGKPVLDENGKPKNEKILKSATVYGKDRAYTIGTAYGWIVERYNLIDNLIHTIKHNPTDRRMIMSLWQNEWLKTAVLPSCVYCSEWDVTDGKLNTWVHQRSCDVPLGLPFNVTQYAVLQSMLAHVTGLKPGKLFWSIKDAHIYVNQIDGIKEQINRYDALEDLEAPKLWLNEDINDFYDFDNSKELKDIKILGYKHHGKISFPIAQ